MRLFFTFITAITLLAAPVPALAQQDTHKLIISERAIAAGMGNTFDSPFDSRFSRVATESLAQGGQRDSFKNGTIIGAVIGAVAMGSAVGALWQDKSEWWRIAVLNTARMSWFSADRAILDYAREIWRAEPGLA